MWAKVWHCWIAAEVLLTSKLIAFKTLELTSAYSYLFNFYWELYKLFKFFNNPVVEKGTEFLSL